MVDNWSIKFLVPVIFFPHLLKMGPAIDYCVCISFIRLCFFVLFCFFGGGGGDIINVVLSKHWCKLADTCYHFMMWYKRYWLKYKCWHYTWQFSIEKVNKTCMKIFWILKSFWICLITLLIIIYDWLNFTVTLINTNWKNWLLDNTFCNQKLCVSTICSVHLVMYI